MATIFGIGGILVLFGIHAALHLADGFPFVVMVHPRHDLLSWAAAWGVATILAALIAAWVAPARALTRAVPFAAVGCVLAIASLTVYSCFVFGGTPDVAGFDGSPEVVVPFHLQLAPTLIVTVVTTPLVLAAGAWRARSSMMRADATVAGGDAPAPRL